MAGLRSYDDPCGVARALDRVGERWALLIVRELLLGPKRFGDLRGGLVHASPNVLSQRLDELERCGVVARRQLPPPANVTVYELTGWGKELEPVVLALGRWGSRATPVPRGALSVDALLIALETTFDPHAAKGLTARVELRLGLERFALIISRGQLQLARGPCPHFDVALTTDPATLRQLVFAKLPLARAKEVQLEGDEAVAARFLTLFPRPLTAASSSHPRATR
ncbi:MAG: winged helix-turn-helix transcriptional regulator [Archangium sp.]|nr:winged helix-turn-helix transcriptional regulator [Archangium sp.]